ncbi:VOC family protein [Arthrobacter sp.]|jgi:hypothetical protein|uniref:VOC family protein n=1 Tax=Arthrobacter sp. TaxID=1667 RepID=UPI002F420A01
MGFEDSEQPAAPKSSASEGRETTGSGGHQALHLASAVMFVGDLDRSVAFYQEFLEWDVTIHDESAALLVGPVGYQLYLRSMGENAQHPLGNIGIQYLIWTAQDEADLDRCEQALRKHSSKVTRRRVEGFSLVEGRGPDGVPVMVAYPGPAQAPRHEILQRIYQW